MKTRKNYLDNIRWITILLVVVFHVYYYYNNVGVEPMFEGVALYDGHMTLAGLFQYFVYPWFMVLLFVVAGMSARYALKIRTTWEFLISRVDKILVPSTLGIVAFGWIGGFVIYTHTISMHIPTKPPAFVVAFISIWSGTGALWFCHVLFLASIILLIVRVVFARYHVNDDIACGWFEDKSKSLLGYIVILILMFLILWDGSRHGNIPVVTAYRNGIYIPAFLFGFYIFSNDDFIERLKRIVLPLFVLAVFFGIIYIKRCYGMDYAAISTLSGWDVNLYAYLMVLLSLGIGSKFLNQSNQFTEYMKQRCFGIYVLHIPILLVTNYLLIGSGFPMIAVYFIELLSALAFSLLFYEIIRRIPILRYWILGYRDTQ